MDRSIYRFLRRLRGIPNFDVVHARREYVHNKDNDLLVVVSIDHIDTDFLLTAWVCYYL